MSFSKIGSRVKRSYGTTRKDGSKKPDLMKDPSNPTGAICANYQRLMYAYQDLSEMKFQTIALVAPLRDNGMSENHWLQFERTVQEAQDIEELQQYITNYMMAGGGLGVLDTSR